VIITTNIATIRGAITFRKCTGWGNLRVPEVCGRVNQWNPLLWHHDRSLKMCPLNIAKLHVLISIQYNFIAIKTQEMTDDIHLGLHSNLISCMQVINQWHQLQFWH
jgi:hypothetical protein